MASIEFPPIGETVEDVKEPVTLFDVIFTVIAVLAAGFSGYTTYIGFGYDLPFVASVAIAVIIGLGLLAINFKIREHRIAGDSVRNPLIAFFLFFIFSFISNTNAIYTYFLQNDIGGQTRDQAWVVFDKGTSTILEAIDTNDVMLEKLKSKQQLDVARKNLMRQITDLSNPGLGEIARTHLEEVERVLGERLTSLRPPPANSSQQQYKAYAKRLDDLIAEQFSAKYREGVSEDISKFERKIIALRDTFEELVSTKSGDPSETTDVMKRTLESLAVEATKLIGFKEDIQKINNTSDDIGSFQYTWANFSDGINKAAIALSILLSIMLDILAPALSLLLYKKTLEY